MAKFHNYYKCSECGHEWEDRWECACDDRCPVCRTSNAPYESEDCEDKENAPTDEA